MRKSQERIAAILGLGHVSARGLGEVANRKHVSQGSIADLVNERRQPYHVPTAPLRTQSDRYSPSEMATAPQSLATSSMVRQSLADLKQRLNQMRMEKQKVENELNEFENNQQRY